MFKYLSDIRVISDKYHIVKSEFITHQCCSRFGEIFVGIIHMSGKDIQYAEDMSGVDSIQVLNYQDHILFCSSFEVCNRAFYNRCNNVVFIYRTIVCLIHKLIQYVIIIIFLSEIFNFLFQILKQPKPLYCQHNFWKIFTRNSYVCNIIDQV